MYLNIYEAFLIVHALFKIYATITCEKVNDTRTPKRLKRTDNRLDGLTLSVDGVLPADNLWCRDVPAIQIHRLIWQAPRNESWRSPKIENPQNPPRLRDDGAREKCSHPDWIWAEPFCVYISKAEDKRSWEDSRRYCQIHEGDLWVVSNKTTSQRRLVSDPMPTLNSWIGLMSDEQSQEFYWVDGSKETFEKRRLVYAEANISGPTCVSMIRSSWHAEPCWKQRQFICLQTPEFVKYETEGRISSSPPPSETRFGDIIKIACTGYFRHERRRKSLCLVEGTSRLRTVILLCDGDYVSPHGHQKHVVDVSYHKVGKVCLEKRVATFTIVAIKKLDGSKLQCCSRERRDDGKAGFKAVRCSKATDPFSVHIKRRRPEVTNLEGKEYAVGQALSFRCTSEFGSSEEMTLAMASATDDLLWWSVLAFRGICAANHRGLTFKDDYYGERPININRTVGFMRYLNYSTDTQGARDYVDMTIEVIGKYHRARIGCFPYNASKLLKSGQNIFTKEAMGTWTGRIIVNSVPAMSPELTVHYHGPEPVVYGGQDLRARCEAHVETKNTLTWVLQTSNDLKNLNKSIVFRRDHVYPGVRIRPVDVPDAMKRLHLRPRRASEFSIVVNSSLNGAFLKCTCSPADRPEVVIKENSSLALEVQYLPRRPTLSVSSTVRERKQFNTADCSASVGSEAEGVLTMCVLVPRGPNASMKFELNTNATTYFHEHITVLSTTSSYDSVLGPRITASIEVQVSSRLQDARIACFSYNTSCFHVNLDTDDTLMAYHWVIYKSELSGNRHIPAVMIILVAIVSAFLVLGLWQMASVRIFTGINPDEEDLSLTTEITQSAIVGAMKRRDELSAIIAEEKRKIQSGKKRKQVKFPAAEDSKRHMTTGASRSEASSEPAMISLDASTARRGRLEVEGKSSPPQENSVISETLSSVWEWIFKTPKGEKDSVSKTSEV